MVPTGRNAGGALATIPASQKKKFDELRWAVGPIAEMYLIESVIPPWLKVKDRMLAGEHSAPGMREKIKAVDEAIEAIPGEIILELTAPKSSGAFNAAGYKARKAIQDMLTLPTQYTASSTDLDLLQQALDSQQLVDGTASRMP